MSTNETNILNNIPEEYHERFKEALKNTFAGDIDYTKAPSNAVLMFKLGFAWGIESK